MVFLSMWPKTLVCVFFLRNLSIYVKKCDKEIRMSYLKTDSNWC